MMVLVNSRTLRTKWWCAVILMMAAMVIQVTTLNGPNVCMVKQKYNITKRVKYRAPMSVRSYVWCFSMPPRCSIWKTEMRDLTRLETEERTAEVAVCCPGYKMKDVSCVPICPNGKTGPKCSEDCPPYRWGPNCVNECGRCQHGDCSPITGECQCQRGWQGESCELRMTTTTQATSIRETLVTHTNTATSLPTPITSLRSASETKTPTYTIPVTSPALSLTTTSTVIPTTASTKMTFPMTIKTTTETLMTTSKKPKTNIVTTTESFKKLLTSSTTKVIEEFETLSLHTTAPNNNSEITLPTTPSTALKLIPNIASKNIISNPHTTNSTTFKTTKEIKETTTSATTSTDPEKDILPNAIIIPTTDEPKIIEKEIITTVPTTTSTKAKLSSTTELSIIIHETTKSMRVTTLNETTTMPSSTLKETAKSETTKKLETTLRVSSTPKFKPKEIWIKPAQKGETIEAKKIIHDLSKHRVATNKDFETNTTPKTIIVSIIPTSVSYATFKRIALTTASFIAHKVNSTVKTDNKSREGFTRPMSSQILTTPATVNITTPKHTNLDELLIKDLPFEPVTSKDTSYKAEINKTNSMTEKPYIQLKPTIHSTSSASSTTRTTVKKTFLLTNPTIVNTTPAIKKANTTHKPVTEHHKNTTTTKAVIKVEADKKSNNTKMLTNYKVTTEDPTDEETFHILTEPEHITAVMGEKETGRSSIDLVSVISIAGGVMMAVITVAVVIVMIERCRRPRYEDVRKINDIRMQVMIDGNDALPPYVRSIFHTPLPEPPMSEKCHYQPISTLDRNLKQFMRPVIVQTISPVMLENFRGILECHYDHLPRRNDFVPMEARCSLAPSMSECGELHHLQRIRDSTLESMKCEAKLDVIDTTTSEPLYAEIPCWRPPSEHAIEIMNLNGEAVTEL